MSDMSDVSAWGLPPKPVKDTRPRQGIQLSNGDVLELPRGISADMVAESLGVELRPRPEDRRPPEGLPDSREIDLSDDDYDEVVMPEVKPGGGSSSASATFASSTAGTATTADPDLISFREATKQVRDLMGRISIITVGGDPFVKRADLDALKSRRGSKVKLPSDPAGAGETISREVKNARDARSRSRAHRKSRRETK